MTYSCRCNTDWHNQTRQHVKCFIKIKEQYGHPVIHPACETSRLLAQIAGTKTLTSDTIMYAKRLGYTFEETSKQL